MATTLGTLRTQARIKLLELTARYWTDAELLDEILNGVKALWKDIIDLNQDHFVTIDETNVSATASVSALAGIPADVFRIIALQPRTLGPTVTNRGLIFKPRGLTHPDFVQSEAMDSVTPTSRVIYYATINAGAPVAAPSIRIAPRLSADTLLTLKYIPTLSSALDANSNNPIPGESDKAVVAYCVAFSRAKERDDRSPDPEWLSIYATEARKILTALTPRSVQEPEYVVGMWEHEQSGTE